MKSFFNLLLFIVMLLFLQECNTLNNARVIQIEVFKPGKFVFPVHYNSVVVRNNNCNVSYNLNFSHYFQIDKILNDTTNIDSIAGEIYFQAFVYSLEQQHFFDTITEIASGNYSGDHFIAESQLSLIDSLELSNLSANEKSIHLLGHMLTRLPGKSVAGSDTFVIKRETGLYSKEQLKQIADSTQADLLISLDYFASVDGLTYIPQLFSGARYALSQGFWNLYDLKLLKLNYAGNRIDTVSWDSDGENWNDINKRLPPRKDAILNAAEISGSKFAEILIPHWSEVERLYYKSGQVDLMKAESFIKEGKWLEAAKIWKTNINNPNKYIVAKSMFNLGLACEMEGDLDAALDWVVRSYYIFGEKNTAHAMNCKEYIKILGNRKIDFKHIDSQLSPEATPID